MSQSKTSHTRIDDSSPTLVVTGGTAGIGLETIRLILERHPEVRVAMVGRTSEATQQGLAAIPEHSRSRVATYTCDLNSPKEIQGLCEKLQTHHKKIFGLVNNAGIYPFGGLEKTSLEEWNSTLAVNLNAPFLLIQHLAPAMKRSGMGGRIVNVSSTAGLLPNHFALAYSVSKAALIQLTKTLAKELGKFNITVNCVCPGIVKTPMHEAYHRNSGELEQFYAKRGAAYPMGRVGEASDIAHSIAFLLHPESGWITGDVMVVDGGRLLT